MSSRRSKLFNYLRVCFLANLLSFLCVVGFFVFQLRRRSELHSLVKRQFKDNVLLFSSLCQANDIITNTYFNAASSFASNILFSAASFYSSTSSVAPSVSAPSVDVLPDFEFRNYFEVNGFPFVSLRNTHYRKGDFILGYPIEDISPDFVLYRGRYYKIRDDRNEKSFNILHDRL